MKFLRFICLLVIVAFGFYFFRNWYMQTISEACPAYNSVVVAHEL